MNYEQPLGWFLRALHYYAGSGMVVLVLAHMTQVFLHGAYKYPRELTWIMGVCSVAVYAGHVLLRPDSSLGPGRLLGPGRRRLDGRQSAGLGPWLVELLLGGPVIGGNALSRFFTVARFRLSPACC